MPRSTDTWLRGWLPRTANLLRLKATIALPVALGRSLAAIAMSAVIMLGWLGAATTAEALAPSASATGWSVVPSPNAPGSTVSTLSDVSCVSAKACVAIGSSEIAGYRMISEIWNGSTWTLEPITAPSSGAKVQVLNSISCVSKTTCTAVGYWSMNTGRTAVLLPLAEAWNGKNWAVQATPVPNGGQYAGLYGVSCTSATACTAVGYSSLGTLAETWNGKKWSIQSTPNPSSDSSLSGVSCLSTTACFAVGTWYSDQGPAYPYLTPEALAEAWNGTKWVVEPTPPATMPQGAMPYPESRVPRRRLVSPSAMGERPEHWSTPGTAPPGRRRGPRP